MTSQHLEPNIPRRDQLEFCPCCKQVVAMGQVREPDRTRTVTGAQSAALIGSAAAMVVAGVLVAIDILPAGVGRDGDGLISALPLACVAVAFLLHQPVLRPTRGQAVKASLSVAFLLWAAYQLQPGLSVVVNDLAITLFVLDVALVIRDDLRRN